METFESEGLALTRDGRYLFIEGDEDARSAFARSQLQLARSRTDEREQKHRELVEILTAVGPYEVLAQASITYLAIDYDTFREWEDDRLPAHIEYLALRALSIDVDEPATTDPLEVSKAANRAIELVRELFEIEKQLIWTESIDPATLGPKDGLSQYSIRARLESLGVRSPAYSEHLERVVIGCFSESANPGLSDAIGFSGEDALALVRAIAALRAESIGPMAKEARQTTESLLKELKRFRRNRSHTGALPEWMLKSSYDSAARFISFGSHANALAGAAARIAFSADDLSRASGVEVGRTGRFLDAMTAQPGEYDPSHHQFPCGAHPLTERPILLTAEGYIAPVVPLLLDAVRPRMEDLVSCVQSSTTRERFRKRRANYVEAAAMELLESALPGATSYKNLRWASEKQAGELDGLICEDVLALRVECKAGRVAASSRRGAPGRMGRDLGKLISEAQTQHLALDEALRMESAEQLGFALGVSDALRNPIQVHVVVTLDDLTVWSTEAHRLRSIGVLQDLQRPPWVVSLTDLMAITDLLSGSQFVQYLMRRRRLEEISSLSAHDELDWVGHYILEGLYFEDLTGNGEHDRLALMSYTEYIDTWYFSRAGVLSVPVPKPSRNIPSNLQTLIGRLEQTRPSLWIAAALALLGGDQQVMRLWHRMIRHVYERAALVGGSDASQVYSGRYGITFLVSRAGTAVQSLETAQRYAIQSLVNYDVPVWLVIAEGPDRRPFVVAEGDDSPRLLLDLLTDQSRPERSPMGSQGNADDPEQG